MIEPDGLHAVVTGDTVQSSEFSSQKRRALPDLFHETYDTIRDAAQEDLPYDLAITGGDGWQWYIQTPRHALARTLHFWTSLFAHGVESRMTLVVDTVDFLSEEDLNESDGPAFRRSGRLLADVPADTRFRAALPDAASTAHHIAIESISELIDHLLQQWTEAQARAVSGMLPSIGTDRDVTQEEIAQKWSPDPVTRQTVNRHLKRANWDRVQRTLDQFDGLVESLLNE